VRIVKGGRVNRRDFLKEMGTALGTIAAVNVVPSKVFGANDRIRIGVIGCGGMGTAHLRGLVGMSKSGEENIEVVAVCDIYEPRKARAEKISGAKVFHDYRELLELKDVDVVWIATPDHWHAKMAIDAMEAGKDIYLEKPMTHTWQEAKEVFRTAKRTGRIVQVGSQWCSEPKWKKANELIRAGEIGKVVWAQTSYCRNSREGEWNYPIDKEASPQNLDWDMWLGWKFGLAPKRPFDPERYFRWRKYWDYSGGIATDLFPHVLHTLLTAIGPEFPRRVVAGGGIYVHKDREVPDTFHMIADYPGEYSVVVLSSMANEKGVSTMIRGHEATMYLDGQNISIEPERIATGKEQKTVELPPVPDLLKEHHKDFLRCVRERKEPNCPVDLAYKVMVAVDMAVLSYREGKVKMFDPAKEEMIS
jgi:predicted dehydrogenase